jgi:hypothetical protein
MRRVGLGAGTLGVLLAVAGVLACSRGSWPLAVLGALAIVGGGLSMLIGLGLRVRAREWLSGNDDAELDSRLMAEVRRAGGGRCDEAADPCRTCDLGCAPRSNP